MSRAAGQGCPAARDGMDPSEEWCPAWQDAVGRSGRVFGVLFGGGGRHGIPWGWAEADWGAWIEMQVSEGRYLGSDGFSELEMMGEMGVAWVGE